MKKTLALGGLVLASSSLLGLTLAAVVREGVQDDTDGVLSRIERLEEAGNADVEEHRERNEILHACIVDLALALADPARDRTKPIPNPCPPPLVTPTTPSR